MSKFNTFIIVLTIAIILYILLNSQGKNNGVNNVSFLEAVAASKWKEDNKIRKKVFVEPDEHPLELPIVQQPSATDNQLSYLDIYKKYKLAIDCSGIYMAEDSKYDQMFYVDEFIREIKFRSNKRQTEATEAQIIAYEDFVSECWDLYLEMPDISDLTLQKIKRNPNITKVTLRNLLQSTDAITPEEVELKEVLIAGVDFSKVDRSLRELSRGIHTLDEQELKATYKEIGGKKAAIRKLTFENPHSYDVEQYDMLTLELQEIEDYLANSIVIDELELQSETSRFYEMSKEIFTHARTPYATVFFEVFTTLNFTSQINGVLKPNHSFYIMQKYKQDYQSFSRKIYSDLVIDSVLSNEEYFNHAINPAILLYLCHLGADCSASSIVIRKYCATNRQLYGEIRQYVYSEACGKSVNEFYSQSYLSANLANDVNILLKTLVSQYAH